MHRSETRKTIIVTRDLNIGSNWDTDIRLTFDPDEVIVRSIAYKNTEAAIESYTSYIWTNLIDDKVLGAFCDPCNSSPQSTFVVKKGIAGDYNLQVRDKNDALNTRGGDLMIVLEFIKYAK